MADFGFDSYALEGPNVEGRSHPFEIARDLIAAGKPRSALEVLSIDSERHADDREYLLLCAAAWRAMGDTLRAQQALLGAVRVAPDDPRPLRLLSELLSERGEHDRAERVLAKVRDLERAHEVPLQDRAEELEARTTPTDADDDLIAAAERRERGRGFAPGARHVALALIGFGLVALLVAGVSFWSNAAPETARSEDPAPDEAEETVAAVATPEPLAATPSEAPEPALVELPPSPSSELQTVEVEPAVELSASPAEPEPVAELSPPPLGAKPASEAEPASTVRKRASGGPRASATPPAEAEAEGSHRTKRPSDRRVSHPAPTPSPPEPDASRVQSELATMNPKQLTDRADALHAQGHTAVAASYYRRALDIDPDYAPALVGMGRSILRAEKYEEAMRNATRALQLARGVDARPGLEAEAIYQMGRVHLERGEREPARQLLRQSVTLPGAPAEAWFYLGEALASENSPAARRAYEKYLERVSSGHLAERARRAIQ